MPRDLQIAVRDDIANNIYRNNLVLNNYDLYLSQTNQDYFEQKMFIELRLFFGEWMLNPNKGIPYFEQIFVKNPDLGFVQSIFKDTVLAINGIDTILEFNMFYTPQIRQIAIQINAKTDDDEIINYNVEI